MILHVACITFMHRCQGRRCGERGTRPLVVILNASSTGKHWSGTPSHFTYFHVHSIPHVHFTSCDPRSFLSYQYLLMLQGLPGNSIWTTSRRICWWRPFCWGPLHHASAGWPSVWRFTEGYQRISKCRLLACMHLHVHWKVFAADAEEAAIARRRQDGTDSSLLSIA